MVEMFPSPEQKDAWIRAFAGEPTDWPAVLAERPSLQRSVVKIQPVAASTGART